MHLTIYIFLKFLWDRVSLCSPRTHVVIQAGLELADSHAPALSVLGLEMRWLLPGPSSLSDSPTSCRRWEHSSSRVTCLTSEEVKRRAIIFPLSEQHHKVAILHFLFCCYIPKRDAFDWKHNSRILDIRFQYFAWWHFAKLWLLQSRWSSCFPFF